MERVMEATERLRGAAAAMAKVAGTDAERAWALADILQRALDFHASHGDGDCPVCGRQQALGPSWRQRAEAEMGQLRVAAGAAEAARCDRDAALRAARELLTAPPDVLDQAEQVGVDRSAAMLAWRQWAEGPTDDDPEALATHLERRLDPLDAALERPELEGTATRRRVKLAVTVDGADGTALG